MVKYYIKRGICIAIKTIDNFLTKKDIEILRKAYNNYTVPVDYLSVDVKNLMFYEGLSKSQAINKILTFISNT